MLGAQSLDPQADGLGEAPVDPSWSGRQAGGWTKGQSREYIFRCSTGGKGCGSTETRPGVHQAASIEPGVGVNQATSREVGTSVGRATDREPTAELEGAANRGLGAGVTWAAWAENHRQTLVLQLTKKVR